MAAADVGHALQRRDAREERGAHTRTHHHAEPLLVVQLHRHVVQTSATPGVMRLMTLIMTPPASYATTNHHHLDGGPKTSPNYHRIMCQTHSVGSALANAPSVTTQCAKSTRGQARGHRRPAAGANHTVHARRRAHGPLAVSIAAVVALARLARTRASSTHSKSSCICDVHAHCDKQWLRPAELR